MNQPSSALLTDLYQLTMLQGYLQQRMEDTSVFEFFVRKLPPRRGFLVAAGLEQALSYLETLRFTSWELDWIAKSGRFSAALVEYLTQFRFTGLASSQSLFVSRARRHLACPLRDGHEGRGVPSRLPSPILHHSHLKSH